MSKVRFGEPGLGIRAPWGLEFRLRVPAVCWLGWQRICTGNWPAACASESATALSIHESADSILVKPETSSNHLELFSVMSGALLTEAELQGVRRCTPWLPQQTPGSAIEDVTEEV